MKIMIGEGSCGIASGAKKTEEEFRKIIKAEKLKAELDYTGCVGTCYLEPIVDVYDDNGDMTRYVKVQPKDVRIITLYLLKTERCYGVMVVTE